MGFYQDLIAEFGRPVVSQMKEYSNNQHKLASLHNRNIFLIRCRGNGIVPRHVGDRTGRIEHMFEFQDPRTGQQVHRFAKRLDIKLVNLEISITIKNIDFINKKLSSLEQSITEIIPIHMWSEFKRRLLINYNTVYNRIKRSNLSKYRKLYAEQSPNIKVQDKWIKNLTGIEIPTEVNNLLALGPKFSIRPACTDVSIPKLLAEIEHINRGKELQVKNLVSTRATHIITEFFNSHHPGDLYFNSMFKKTRLFLREHPAVLVMSADKGGTTVLLNKTDYSSLSEELLQDRDYYTPLQRDPTSSIQQRANKIISELREGSVLSNIQAKNLMIYNATSPKFYGLPKIHKPQLKLRPIISSINSPNSKIAGLLCDVLTKAYNRENDYYTHSSFEFSNFINNFKLPDNFVLISLDVVSLFTNIPLQLVVTSIRNHWTDIQPHCSFDLETFLELLTFTFNSTYFSYNNSYYKQIKGTPMGSQLSPIISQYVMDDILDAAIAKLPFQIPFCKKYVDDIICSTPSGKEIETLNIFNSIQEDIQFTVETETENAVPFLDMKIHRVENDLKTNWYIKPTSSGRYINYHSFHSMKTKINVILNMKNRILKVSHPDFHQHNLQRFFEIMKMNAYPHGLLQRLVFGTPNRPAGERTADHPSTKYYSLPHVDQLSTKLMGLLKTEDNETFALKNLKTVKLLFSKIKDKTPLMQLSSVVYEIKCLDCQGCYIGQTSRNLGGRVTSHKSDIRRQVVSCALARHQVESGHRIDLENVKILDTERNLFKRTFIEMIRISQNQNAINSKKDIDNLSSIYTYLLTLDRIVGERQNVSVLSSTS